MNDNQQPVWVRALLDKELSQAAYRVFAYLYWRQGSNGQSWPNQNMIASDLGLSRRAVQIIPKKLEKLGYIKIIRPETRSRKFVILFNYRASKRAHAEHPF